MPWPLPASQPGPDPVPWQSLSLLLPEVGAAAPVLLRVPTTVSGDEPTSSLQTLRGSLCFRVGVCFTHGYSHSGGSLWEPCWQPRLVFLWGAAFLPHWSRASGVLDCPVPLWKPEATQVRAPCPPTAGAQAPLWPSPAWPAALGGSRVNSLVPFGPSSPPQGRGAASRSLRRVAQS